jgi:UbiD family decarboxylases
VEYTNNLKSYLNQVKKEIVTIKASIKKDYEISAVLKKLDDGPIVLFENVEGYKLKVVGNLCSKRQRLLESFGANDKNYHDKIYSAIENPLPCDLISGPYFKPDPNMRISDLPIPKHYESEKSDYITSGIVIGRLEEEKIQNSSVHRLMKIDDETFGIRVVPRHLYSMIQESKKKGKVLNIAICIGAHPAVYLSAGLSPRYGYDHIHVANRLLNGSLHQFKCANGVYALSESEIIMEGYIDPSEELEEGPFTDLTGTPDIIRKQPVVHITKIYVNKDSIYQDILPAGNEHYLLMGLGREVLIHRYVERITPFVRKVRLIKGGCGWLIAVVSVRKIREGDAKNVIAACFAAHPSLKIAIVVDEDIDPDNPEEVHWALATRLNPSKGIIVINDATVSSLDPSADQDLALGSKLGIDATISFKKPISKYMRSKIPVNEDRLNEILKYIQPY